MRDDERGGGDSAAFEHACGEEKNRGGKKRGNICFISIQGFETDEPVLSIGGGVSNTEKCCLQQNIEQVEIEQN